MVEITLVRHGQANTGAQDEASYDRLSPLGHQQAQWLGAALAEQAPYGRLVHGTLRRQKETAAGLALGLVGEVDKRLNELNYFGLAESLRDRAGIGIPKDIVTFSEHVPQVLNAWRAGDLHEDLETYDQFCDRVFAVAQEVAEAGIPSVLVTSTGVIATLTARALGLDMTMKSRIFLKVMNTSVHKFVWQDGAFHLAQYGAVPHLDIPGREYARTYG